MRFAKQKSLQTSIIMSRTTTKVEQMNRKLDSIEEGINEKVDTIMLTQGGQAGFSKMKNSNQQRMFQ